MGNDRRCKVARLTGGVALVLLNVATAGSARAQGNPNQFGGQDRANAISQMTVLGVQQGISSLPPTLGSFPYEFDFDSGAWVRTRLGPTVFRAAETIGAHNLSFRLGVSYFDLADSFGPINYLVQFDKPDPQGNLVGVVGLGATADVNVTVMNLSATYGLSSRVDLTFNLPLTVVRANASQTSSTMQSAAGLPSNQAVVGGVFQSTPLPSDPTRRAADIAGLSRAFETLTRPGCGFGPNACLVYRRDSFNALGFDFNQGTQAGVGRISLGGKASLYTSEWVQFAFMTEFFMPSPNQGKFAGPDSAAILPRGILVVPAADWLRFFADLGYDYDFDKSALRRLVWNVGPSVPFERFEFDLGVGGSQYNTPIQWTPAVAHGAPDAALGVPGSTITALGNNQLGDSFIDFIGGLKVRLGDRWVLSGAVDVPLNNQGFRAAALGTLALEYYVQGG